jgi:hypothetical protein
MTPVPECPEVESFRDSLYNDPMTDAMGAPTDEISESWEKKHIGRCKRCREYGCANIEVVEN